MPRFVFKLEAALRQRRHHERAKQIELAAQLHGQRSVEDDIHKCQRMFDEERLELRERLTRGGGAVALRGLRMQANAAGHLIAAIHAHGLRLAGARERVTRARAVLIAATTRRRAIERLRERRYDQWRRDQDLREARELDDLVTTRAGRIRNDQEIVP